MIVPFERLPIIKNLILSFRIIVGLNALGPNNSSILYLALYNYNIEYVYALSI